MYAITGISGKVGGALARTLLAANQPVRAVVRDPAKARVWADRGCEIALASLEEPDSLAAAFANASGVFILPPSNFDPADGFPEARTVIAAVMEAIVRAEPKKVVCLSTIGAQATQINLLTQRTLMEEALRTLPIPVALLRPAWFMENSRWDVVSAMDTGVMSSFLQPLDKPVPMVATTDVGRVAAELLLEKSAGTRVVELEGPKRISPNDVAATFGKFLGRPVRAQVVERAAWEALFRAGGAVNPFHRMRMLDGFNEGFIDFEHAAARIVKGTIHLESVLRTLI